MNISQLPIKPLVIAHRGASIDHYENTIAAFEAAKEQGADWVELDVRRSEDGVNMDFSAFDREHRRRRRRRRRSPCSLAMLSVELINMILPPT